MIYYEYMIQNRTIQNRSKQKRLNAEHVIPFKNIQGGKKVVEFLQSLRKLTEPKEQILFSIGHYLLQGNKNPNVKDFLSEYNYKVINIEGIPTDEFDLLGSAYQFLNSKKENLEKGSFYTCFDIAKDFVKGLDFSCRQIIFDLACGSGVFLFTARKVYPELRPEQIVGVDSDPIAIMIAKFNYFLIFPDAKTPPQLFCADFFQWFSKNEHRRFHYIISNPPYGASLDLSKIVSKFVKSGESFSYFIEFGYKLLHKDGIMRFLLPESILNVRKHADIRDFILDYTNLRKIKRYSKKFDGVMSDVYMIELDSNEHQKKVVFENGEITLVPKKVYKNFQNHIFVQLTKQDISILEKVNRLKRHDLSESVFALGVVTGDNKTKLLSKKEAGAKHIYTGKEVEKYRLLDPTSYLIFDRSNLQQVAPDEIYSASEKLVYKTINKFLKIAQRNSQLQ